MRSARDRTASSQPHPFVTTSPQGLQAAIYAVYRVCRDSGLRLQRRSKKKQASGLFLEGEERRPNFCWGVARAPARHASSQAGDWFQCHIQKSSPPKPMGLGRRHLRTMTPQSHCPVSYVPYTRMHLYGCTVHFCRLSSSRQTPHPEP